MSLANIINATNATNGSLHYTVPVIKRAAPSVEDQKKAMAVPLEAAAIFMALLVFMLLLGFCGNPRKDHSPTHPENQDDSMQGQVAGRKSDDIIRDVDTEWSEDNSFDLEKPEDKPFSFIFSANKVRPGMQPCQYDSDSDSDSTDHWSKRISGILGGIPNRKRLVDEEGHRGSKKGRWLSDAEVARI